MDETSRKHFIELYETGVRQALAQAEDYRREAARLLVLAEKWEAEAATQLTIVRALRAQGK